ncbi:MAG: hypothetical protein ACKVQS_13755, partial [Fimbriimonadaceae bacterium]
ATQLPFTVPTEFTSSLPGENNSKYQVAGTYTIEDLSTTTKKIAVRIQWRNAAANQGVVAPWSEVRLVTQIARPGSIGGVIPVSPGATTPVTIPTPYPTGKPTISTSGGILGSLGPGAPSSSGNSTAAVDPPVADPTKTNISSGAIK